MKPDDTEGKYYIVFIKLLRKEIHAVVMIILIAPRKAAAVRVQKGFSTRSRKFFCNTHSQFIKLDFLLETIFRLSLAK